MKGGVILALAWIPFLGFCKSAGSVSGDGHSGDMVKVLGIDLSDHDAKDRAIKLTSGFAKFIDDDYEILLHKIREIAPTFSSRGYRHRLFFHWGLSGNPRDISVLSDCVKEAALGNTDLEDKIWGLILDEQARRNREMFSVVSDAYFNVKGDGRPAPFRHDDIRGIASIVYDTHIIGDYIVGTEKTQMALISLDSVKNDVIRSVRGIAIRDTDFRENKLLNKFRKDIQGVIAGSREEQAIKILQIMKDQIPVILEKCPRVGKTLKVKTP